MNGNSYRESDYQDYHWRKERFEQRPSVSDGELVQAINLTQSKVYSSPPLGLASQHL